jgi:hypothetical protein
LKPEDALFGPEILAPEHDAEVGAGVGALVEGDEVDGADVGALVDGAAVDGADVGALVDGAAVDGAEVEGELEGADVGADVTDTSQSAPAYPESQTH